jgi:hypothetical protein
MHIIERAIIGYDKPDMHPRLANLQGLERVEAWVLLLQDQLQKGTVHPQSHEEDPGKWVYHCRPRVRVSRNDTCKSCWVSNLHISRFEIHVISMV